MKYARTRDGFIFEIEKNLGKYGTSKAVLICDMQGNVIDLQEQNNILKQADTIEELCDVFVYAKCDYMELEEAKREKEWNELDWQQDGLSIYGAIWTDKGLIYVAKMNDEGELKLL